MDLKQTAFDLRKTIVKMCYVSGSGHLTSSASCMEILISLYFDGILKYNALEPEWDGRDYFVLSKGHAAMGLYAVLAKAGFIEEKELWTFCAKGTRLGGHPKISIPGVEAATGSLGHGMSIACGIALALKMQGKNNKVICMTGDGELQEGSNWEAALAISQFNLKNFIWIIDNNKIQLAGKTNDIISVENLHDKISAFGFDVLKIDGHDFDEIKNAFAIMHEKPLAIIANTVKGKGFSCAEGQLGWHGKKPSKDEFEKIFVEFGITEKDLRI